MLTKKDLLKRAEKIKDRPEPDMVKNNKAFFKLAYLDEVSPEVEKLNGSTTDENSTKTPFNFETIDKVIYLVKGFEKKIVDEFNGVACYFSNEGNGWHYCTLDTKRKVKDEQVIDVLEDFWDSQSEPYRPVYIDFDKNEYLKDYKKRI